MRRAWWVAKRSVVSFSDDQGTHHAAALTYYALMSLFPLLLLAVSLLGLLGEFPGTYNSIIHYLRRVVPATTLAPLDAAVRAALRSKGTALAALVLGVLVALYGATGYLEATRRALNVVFDSHHGRSRKLTDLASTVVLLALVLATVVLMFAGVGVVHDLFGPGAATVWRIGRWPAALISALLVFSLLYFVTPDIEQRAFRWITPGAAVGVWKHGFEQEIDDHGRALVLALVSLPRRVELAHLEAAFEALCRERHLSLGNRAFKRTLAALDDSLVRTLLDSDHWRGTVSVAEPHDPSIIDFIVDFLRASPEDVRELARASVFFEQASWLWATVGPSSGASAAKTRAELQAALQRAYPAIGISAVTVRVGPSSFSYREKGTRNFESRLVVLLDVARQNSEFAAWWSEAFAAVVSDWRQGKGEPESTLKLLAAVEDRDGVDRAAAAAAAKKVLAAPTSYAQSLEWLHQLRSLSPEALSRDEWDQYVTDFETWLRDDLASSAEDMSDSSELRFIDHVADLLGVSIDDDVWFEATEAVERNEAERDGQIDPPDPDYDRGSSGLRDWAAERREIEAIFTRLAE